MKHFPMKVICCLLLVLLLAGCGAGNGQVSENAQTVINAVMNAPNTDLYDEIMLTTLGIGTSAASEEELAQREAKAEEIKANWKEAVGDCFSEDSFDTFLNSGVATMYHIEGILFGTERKVLSMSLESRDDYLETVNVELSVNGETQNVTVLLRSNDDGLFYEMELAEGQ